MTRSLPRDSAAGDGRVLVADELGHAVSVIAGARALRQIPGFTRPGGVAAFGKGVTLVDVGADVVTLIDGPGRVFAPGGSAGVAQCLDPPHMRSVR